MNMKPEMYNRRFKTTGLAKPFETHRLKGIGADLARQELTGLVFGRVWYQTNLFSRVQTRTAGQLPRPDANTS